MRLTDDENVQINRYVDLSAKANHARPCPLDKTPTAWSTLNATSDPVTQDVLATNLAWMHDHSQELPLHTVLVDEGWQSKVGDWLTVDKVRFSDGMAGLAGKIAAEGHEPGLWLAPFVAQAGSSLCANHPDWFVRDASGRPINVVERWGGPCYALDLTNEAVLEWLQRIIHTVVADWGFRYLKLDLLRYGSAFSVVSGFWKVCR